MTALPVPAPARRGPLHWIQPAVVLVVAAVTIGIPLWLVAVTSVKPQAEAIKPNLSRRRQLPQIRAANALIRACAQERGVDFLDVHQRMLGADGEAAPRWFDVDGLHLNAEGYALWTGEVRGWLAKRGLLQEPAQQ